jgi:hypothetical protein
MRSKRVCNRKYTKKYVSRLSPPFSANLCKGRKKMGNDGTMYLSKPTLGSYRWFKQSKKNVKKTDVKSTKKQRNKR